jgi:glycosyltransferase involved in cell wall biosynthesis
MTAPKKILYVGNFLVKHGKTPNFNIFLIPHLREFFSIVTSSEKKNRALRLIDMVGSVFRMRKHVQLVLVDVYSTDAFWYAYLVGKAARMCKLPYINILHGGNLPHRLSKSPKLSQELFMNSCANVSPSLYLKEEFEAKGYTTTYIPNFIEIERYENKERSKVGPKLLWVRSFHSIYNPLLAIKTFRKIRDKYPDAELCMIGPDKDGSQPQTINLAKKLGVFEGLRITGRLSLTEWTDIAKEYDIFINTTNFDNHPVSVIEAMALGFPIVTTQVGGLPFLLTDREEAILVPPDNEEAFANAILELIDNPDLAHHLSVNARRKAETFTWQQQEEKWLNIIESCT